MMKKFMQVPDASMSMYFELLTDVPLDDAREQIAGNPKQAKLDLGRAVIAEYHGAPAAAEAAQQWEREVGQGGVPTDLPEVTLARAELDPQGQISALGLLKALKLCATTSDAIRLIDQGGAYLYHGTEKSRIESGKQMLSVSTGTIVRAGKKKACRVRLVP
jgi:tyrosyl-tRNA synthetase